MSIVIFGAVFIDIKGNPLNIFIPNGRNEGLVEQIGRASCRERV